MSLRKSLACSLGLALLLLGLGEAAARLHYWSRHERDVRWLIAPIGFPGHLGGPPATPEYSIGRTAYTVLEPCTDRLLTFTVNSAGGRGPEWALSKPPGAVRILTIGASTTFGVSSPDEATWPARLEEELRRRHGRPIEVLNAGVPEARLQDLLAALSDRWLGYRPDLVLYYEGYNDAGNPFRSVDRTLSDFHHHSLLGRLASVLYYRSLLYTYLVEKTHIARLKASQRHVAEALAAFQGRLRDFVAVVRGQGASPVVALQVMRYAEDPRIRQLRLDRDDEIRALELAVTRESEPFWAEWFQRIRVHGAQVFVEAVRRTGEAEGVQVIDPRPAFADRLDDPALFCDERHLTDEANAILAREIARQLDLSPWLGRTTGAAGGG